MEIMNRKTFGCQGEKGSFSALAATQFASRGSFAATMTLVSFSNFDELFEALKAGVLDYAVVPVENSTIGPIRQGVENFERLLRWRPAILSETEIRVTYHLIGPAGSAASDVRCVYSHPMALLQCQRYLERNRSRFTAMADDDTAGSVKRIVEGGDIHAAAIASEFAANVYGGTILEREIGDSKDNFTRFFLLGPRGLKIVVGGRSSAAMKTSIVFRVRNHPNALAECLNIIGRHRINLAKIMSRPIRNQPWEYLFHVDFEVPSGTDGVDGMIGELKKQTQSLDILGSYEVLGGGVR